MRRGRLRIYLGAAPGVGKTYAMLAEGRRRAARGADVVVAVVDDQGREPVRALAAQLAATPGATAGRLDLAAVLRRRPTVALVDELAAPNPAGSRNPFRHQDVDELLAAGIDVVTTINVHELESLADTVAAITGIVPDRLVPDEVVRRAEQVELVDMAPEALLRRVAHGNVYPPERMDAELASYFRIGNLTALRELALLWLADQVDEGLARYREEKGIAATWPARERVVVAVPGDPAGDAVLRRGARLAGRTSGGELLAVHVERPDGRDGTEPVQLAQLQELTESLGGSFHRVVGEDVAASLLSFARGANATQLVLGAGRRSRWRRLMTVDVATEVVRDSGDIDVHLVNRAGVAGSRRPRRSGPGPARQRAGSILAVAGPLALVGLLELAGRRLSFPIELLLFLSMTVAVALVGGLWPAVASALLGSLAINYFFTPPLHTFTIAEPQNAFALLIFLAVAVAVASVVDLAARRAEEAARSHAEAVTLGSLAHSALRGGDDVGALLERLRATFAMQSAALLERADVRGAWQPVAVAGESPPPEPGACDVEVTVGPHLVAALRGHPLAASDQRVLQAFAAYLGVVMERARLSARVRDAQRLEEGNAIRTALLAAVSHDLRTPLAGIKAAVSSLRQEDVEWTADDEAALLATIEESADRLDTLVANLLDMSRLQTGSVEPQLRPVSLDEVVPRALTGVQDAAAIDVDVPESLPLVHADPGLLERVVANLVENAVRHGGGSPVRVAGSALGEQVELRVVDRGPGVGDDDKARIFAPFQRLGDVPAGAGVGLGLAVARGFTEATGGRLWAEDTPGGGLTMVLSLPAERT